jgi:hypothetical protein
MTDLLPIAVGERGQGGGSDSVESWQIALVEQVPV